MLYNYCFSLENTMLWNYKNVYVNRWNFKLPMRLFMSFFYNFCVVECWDLRWMMTIHLLEILEYFIGLFFDPTKIKLFVIVNITVGFAISRSYLSPLIEMMCFFHYLFISPWAMHKFITTCTFFYEGMCTIYYCIH